MAIYRKYTEWGRRISIGKGETYCPKCEGKGCKFGTISTGSIKTIMKIPCGFCQGWGKADWIQIATDRPAVLPPPGEYINYLKSNFAEYAALWIRTQIDQEILDSLTTSGMLLYRVTYEILKIYAKSAGVTVVTTMQRKAGMALLKGVIDVGVEGILTGLTLPEDQIKNNSHITPHTQAKV